jgi:hypothetical protein
MKTLPFLYVTIYLSVYLLYHDITFPYPFSLIRFASLTGLVHCHAEPLVTKETYAPYTLCELKLKAMDEGISQDYTVLQDIILLTTNWMDVGILRQLGLI